MEYAERLRVPLRWWVQVTMLLATCWLALIVSMPAWLAWTTFGALTAVGVGLLLLIGGAAVQVGDGVLRAGRAHIPLSLVGRAEALDAAETARLLGVGADARAYLLTRPYLKRAVRVPVLDAADPAPYWLICSRHPERLAAAISAADVDQRRAD